jgi:hypothetical protein
MEKRIFNMLKQNRQYFAVLIIGLMFLILGCILPARIPPPTSTPSPTPTPTPIPLIVNSFANAENIAFALPEVIVPYGGGADRRAVITEEGTYHQVYLGYGNSGILGKIGMGVHIRIFDTEQQALNHYNSFRLRSVDDYPSHLLPRGTVAGNSTGRYALVVGRNVVVQIDNYGSTNKESDMRYAIRYIFETALYDRNVQTQR